MESIKGLGVALATPFNSDLTIDRKGLQALVRYCIDGGVDYLVVLGTTAETATLNKEEKKLVVKLVTEANNDELPLVIGIGGNDTRALEYELKNWDLKSFEAVLSVSPYYNKPTQEGIYRHYMTLAEASPKPIIIYNVPSRTGSNVLPETAIRLGMEHKNIIGVKEACGDLKQIRELIQKAPSEFVILSGDDETACETLLSGGHGVISVLGQGTPQSFKNLVQKALSGNRAEALEIHEQLLPGMKLIFREGNPAGIKALLECRGIGASHVRLPLVEASDLLKKDLREFSRKLQIEPV